MAHIKALAAVVLYLAAVASAAGHHRATSGPREPNVTVDTFGYTGLDGPLNWFGLNTSANGLCARGRNQSPINLNSSIPLGPGSNTTISVDSYPNGTTFENLGATIEVPSNGTLVAGGQSYKLAQFHFHTPSEHRVNLEYFPMEMHFVFETPGKFHRIQVLLWLVLTRVTEDTDAVVAFLVDIGGPADPLLTSIFTYVSDIATPGEATLTGPLDFTNLAHHLTSNEIYLYVHTDSWL